MYSRLMIVVYITRLARMTFHYLDLNLVVFPLFKHLEFSTILFWSRAKQFFISDFL